MEIEVVKEFTFAGAHRLPNYKGKCKNLHGHEWRLQIGVKGPINPKTGMVVDFSEMKRIIKSNIIDFLDHRYLNEIEVSRMMIPFPAELPTAENMVKWIVKYLQTNWKFLYVLSETPTYISSVRLYETPTSYAEWRK